MSSDVGARPFWEEKSLEAMSDEEWDALCDGCGRCCLNKLEDEETGEIFWTNVACKMLDHGTCQCKDYNNRWEYVPDCVKLDVDEVVNHTYTWLPPSCAYRLISEGKPLYWWHHLVSGDRNLVHAVGASVQNRVISEEDIPENTLEDHMEEWPGIDPFAER